MYFSFYLTCNAFAIKHNTNSWCYKRLVTLQREWQKKRIIIGFNENCVVEIIYKKSKSASSTLQRALKKQREHTDFSTKVRLEFEWNVRAVCSFFFEMRCVMYFIASDFFKVFTGFNGWLRVYRVLLGKKKDVVVKA